MYSLFSVTMLVYNTVIFILFPLLCIYFVVFGCVACCCVNRYPNKVNITLIRSDRVAKTFCVESIDSNSCLLLGTRKKNH